MENYIFWNFSILCLFVCCLDFIYAGCPVSTSCRCRTVATRCTTGLTSFPAGVDTTTELLTISGISSKPNTITSLSKSDFTGTVSIQSLTITFSSVQSIADDTFSDLQKLRDLSLANNKIPSLKANAFKGLEHLRTLDLSGNQNCQFDKTLFTHIPNLEELDLGGMGIQELENDFFQSLKKLKVLKLYMNELRYIHYELLAPLAALKTLDINGNQLVGLQSELKPKFATMSSIHMAENPWQCNCQLLWLRELPGSFVSSTLDGSNIVCNGPRKHRFHSYVTIPDDEFVCIPPEVVRCEQTSYSLDVNNKLIISCEFKGDPVPQIKWHRPDGFEIVGRNTASGKYEIYENGTLVIDSVSLDDDGDWTVTAYNRTAHDDKNINVHVIVTTTSTTTTSTTTLTTPTTTPTTTQSTTTTTVKTTKPTSPIIAAISTKTPAHVTAAATNKVTTGTNPGPVNPGTSDKTIVTNDKKTVIRVTETNYGLLVAAAAGGGTFVGIICIIAKCCKRQPPHEKNKVGPFEDSFGL